LEWESTYIVIVPCQPLCFALLFKVGLL